MPETALLPEEKQRQHHDAEPSDRRGDDHPGRTRQTAVLLFQDFQVVMVLDGGNGYCSTPRKTFGISSPVTSRIVGTMSVEW